MPNRGSVRSKRAMDTISHRVKRKLSYLLNDFCFQYLGKKIDVSAYQKKALILAYHGVDRIGNTSYNSRFISQDYFDKQVSFFKTHFNVVSLEQYWLEDFAPDRLNLCITFDDGYRNNITHALPILEKHRVPATFFITTIQDTGTPYLWSDYVDLACVHRSAPFAVDEEIFVKGKGGEFFSTTSSLSLKNTCRSRDYGFKQRCIEALPGDFMKDDQLNDYWKVLSPQDIQVLGQSPLVTLGTHGYFHNCLGNETYENACRELKNSKDYLECLLQAEVSAMAYPDGSYTKPLVDYCESIGYKHQLAMDYLFTEDRHDARIRDRFGINPYCSWNNQLYSLLKGKYF